MFSLLVILYHNYFRDVDLTMDCNEVLTITQTEFTPGF